MDLESSFDTLSVRNTSPVVKNFAALVRGHHTEIVLIHFPNYIQLIVSQFHKIGNLYQVKIDQPVNGFTVTEPIYTITTLFGGDNLDAEVAARYLTEKLKIRKPLLLSLSLKDFTKATINIIIAAIQSYKE